MNPALLYLWFALLKRRAFHFVRSLRRPTPLVGYVYVLGLLGVLFWFRHHDIFRHLVERDILLTGAFLMLLGSLLKGFPKLIAKETGVPVILAENPLLCVAQGAGKFLESLVREKNSKYFNVKS